MPSLIYNDKRYVLVRNVLYCKKCYQTIESKHVHDFKTCKCGAISVDGGISYQRVLGKLEDMEDRSIWRTEGSPKYYLPLEEILRRWTNIHLENQT